MHLHGRIANVKALKWIFSRLCPKSQQFLIRFLFLVLPRYRCIGDIRLTLQKAMLERGSILPLEKCIRSLSL